ncbi:MAG: hypothetical protein IKB05_03315 [Alphaproteobacteria bacterium]|nr:hypothetical protein [Alphaproteobacteria bacterium]
MLKQKFVFAVSLIAMVTVGIGAARADIASTVYVQQGVNSAKTAASAAQTSANNANTAAVNAQTSADEAQEAADAAQASADAAAESAAAANAAVATKFSKTSSVTNAIVTTDGSGNVAPVAIVDSGTGTYVTDVTVSAGKVTLSRGTPASYSLPTASSSTLGGVKIGANITNSNGTISVTTTDTPTSGSGVPLTSGGAYTALSGKQATLSTAQLNAANSGITSAKVTTYDGYASQISAKEASANKVTSISSSSTDAQYPSAKAVYTELAKKQNTLTIDSALSSSSTNPVQNKVINTALSGKQATLSAAQLNAANSGITSNKVSAYDGYAAQISAKEASANKASSEADVESIGADIAYPTVAFMETSIADANTDVMTEVATKEASANKVTSISSSSTDAQYPSAKAVYTELAKKQNTLTIDSALSSSSTNPVQNKVINTALSGKQATLTTTNVTTTGSGNVVTAVTAANGVVTVTKGSSLPTVNNATLTIQRNGTDVGTFTANASSNQTINITDNDTIYTLPTASSTTKGGVKIGANVNVATDGTISVAAPGNATLTIQRNGADVGTFTANASSNKTINITDNDTIYTLPAATSSTLGGVKIGSNITNSSGTISVPAATSSALGVVKTGTNISNSSGTISVATGTPTTLGVVKVGQIPSGSATSTNYATIWVQ